VSDVLSPEWCDAVTAALADLPPGPGGSGVIEVVVSGGEPARLSTVWVIDSGRLASVTSGDGSPEPEVTIPQSRADLEALVSGEVDPAVVFMRGDLKPEGSARAVLAFLSALARADCREVLSSA
jgi:hypothetical protein